MRTSTRIGIVGSGFAVAGSAALAALAPTAAASGGFDSKAQAVSGTVTVGGTPQSLATAAATPSNSPQASSVPASDVTAQLKQGLSGVLGTTDVTLQGPDLVAVEATANDSGTSTACAAVLASSCAGPGTPIVVTFNVGQLVGGLAGVGGPSLPGGLAKDSLQMTLNGPKATCSAGPNGSALSASDDPGTATVSLLKRGGKPVATVPLKSGDVLSQLDSINKRLGPILSSLPPGGPDLTLSPGSAQKGNGKASATAGEVGLSAGGSPVLDIKGATATCGPNNAAGSTGSNPGSPGKPGSPGSPGSPGTSTTGSTVPTSSSTSGEKPLSGVQTDEGRSSSSAPAWLALSGTP